MNSISKQDKIYEYYKLVFKSAAFAILGKKAEAYKFKKEASTFEKPPNIIFNASDADNSWAARCKYHPTHFAYICAALTCRCFPEYRHNTEKGEKSCSPRVRFYPIGSQEKYYIKYLTGSDSELGNHIRLWLLPEDLMTKLGFLCDSCNGEWPNNSENLKFRDSMTKMLEYIRAEFMEKQLAHYPIVNDYERYCNAAMTDGFLAPSTHLFGIFSELNHAFKDDDKKRIIYIINCQRTGQYKVGETTNLIDRWKRLVLEANKDHPENGKSLSLVASFIAPKELERHLKSLMGNPTISNMSKTENFMGNANVSRQTLDHLNNCTLFNRYRVTSEKAWTFNSKPTKKPTKINLNFKILDIPTNT